MKQIEIGIKTLFDIQTLLKWGAKTPCSTVSMINLNTDKPLLVLFNKIAIPLDTPMYLLEDNDIRQDD